MIMAYSTSLYAQSSKKFEQTLQWSSDPNVLEYKIEIKNSSGRTIQSITTEHNSINLSLKEGSYRYRITAYDFLGRESVSTDWINFEVAIAKQPEIKHEKKLESLSEDGKTLELEVNVADINSDTKAELINIETNERISGNLLISSASEAASGLSASETQAANKASFSNVPEGNWKLVITNPSGLSTQSESFEVKDTIKEEKIAAEKAEAERKEKERLEAEKKAKEEAERKERERLAEEKKAKEEAERLAREEAERQERERLERERLEREKEEKFAREKAEREEAERLAREEEERLVREEAERLALEEKERKEAERLAKLEEKEKRKNKPAAGLEIKVGADLVMNLFNSELLTSSNQSDDFREKLKPSFSAAIAYIPDLPWIIVPGFEISGNAIFWSNVMDFNGTWEYTNIFNVVNFQASLIGQVKIVPKILFFDLKAGAGLDVIKMTTNYKNDRESSESGFIFLKLNTGLSIKLIPTKHLVFELGADYNITLTDKIYFSYLLPYFEVGVRF